MKPGDVCVPVTDGPVLARCYGDKCPHWKEETEVSMRKVYIAGRVVSLTELVPSKEGTCAYYDRVLDALEQRLKYRDPAKRIEVKGSEELAAERWAICTMRQRNDMFRALGVDDPQGLGWGRLSWYEIPAPYKDCIGVLLLTLVGVRS